ncbi:MAG: hypothetical protein ACKVHE_25715 [Planctomycetales bacterium]
MDPQMKSLGIHATPRELSQVSPPASSTVDRSAVFQRLRSIWPLVEKFIAIERSRLRGEGTNRRDAGNEAWRLADAAFDDGAIQLAAELRKLVGSTPPGLSLEQAVAWRLSVSVVSVATQRSSRLVEVATALVVQTRLRAAMDCVGDYSFESRHQAEARESVIKFRVSKESCLTEVDRITEVIRSIEPTDQNDEFADELNDLLEALGIAREVITEHWETISLSLPPS